MKTLFTLLMIGAMASAALGQAAPGTRWSMEEPISIPSIETPALAKESGVGGAMSVQVVFNGNGDVISVGSVSGPGDVCSEVSRADIVALRNAAKDIAFGAKFEPSTGTEAEMNTTGFVKFEFPGDLLGTSKEGAIGERDYQAANPDQLQTADASSGKSIVNGRATSLPKPAYPPAARAVRAAGAVQVQVLIDETGQVFSSSAISGHPLLRVASRNAACKATFSPTLLDGKPVKLSGIVVYNFVP